MRQSATSTTFVRFEGDVVVEHELVASRLSIDINTVDSKKHKIQGRFQSMLRLASDREMQARTLAA